MTRTIGRTGNIIIYICPVLKGKADEIKDETSRIFLSVALLTTTTPFLLPNAN